MFYLQATQSPAVVQLGGDTLTVPKFTRGDFKAWGAEVVAEQSKAATAGMDEARRREYQTFYGNVGMDLYAFRKMVGTPDGAERVCRTCFSRADVRDAKTNEPRARKTDAEVEALLSAQPTGSLVSLAWVLADLDDASLFKAPEQPKKEDDGSDPSTPSGRPDSAGTPTTTP